MSTKKLIKALGLIIVVALMAAALPLQAKAQTDPLTEVWVCPTGDCGHTGAQYDTIQEGIDAVAAGGKVNVAPGTYNENITINKANITLQSTGMAEDTIINANKGFGVYILKDLGTVTIDGFTVQGWLTSGIVQGTANRQGTTSRILNNIVVGETGDVNHGNCIQVTGDNSLIEGNTVTGAYYIGTGPYGASGILVYAANNVIVRNNTVSGADIGISVTAGAYHGLGPISGVLVKENEVTNSKIGISVTFDAKDTLIKENFVHGNELGLYEEFYLEKGPTDTVALHNRIVDNVAQASTGATDDTPIPENHVFTAEENWWGSIAGPGASQISGEVDFTPWCGDADCSFLVSAEEPEENGFYVKDGKLFIKGNVNVPGGIEINEPGLTVMLESDAKIENNSSCFVVNASNTQILAEPGAKCTPTGESNGIDVADGLNNITIKGLEIDGSGQTSGTADGIHFAGAISDFVLADNKIHHMKGDGIEFAGEPTGVVDIAGNLFQNNTGLGINAGSFTVLAQYNSWGSYAGPVVSTDISSGVNATPFTHADVTLSPINEETTRVVTSLANVSGRPTVLKDGTLYHLWYGPTDDTLYHSISTNPAEFPVGETVTFSGTAPSEVSSTAIIKEGETFYMVAYDGTNNKAFALYSSTNGTTWTFVKQVFNATNPPMSDLGKIDAPFVFNDGGTYKLYFQKKSADGQRYDIYLATSTAVDGPYVLAQTDPVLSPNTDIAAWDGKFVMHPWVVKDADTGTYYMWYSAHNSVKPQQIGVATSTDGLNWTKSAANPVIGPTGEPTVIKDGDIWRLWYLSGATIKYQTALNPLDLRQTLAYQVTANLVNVNAADVTITYPADLLTIAELTSGTDLPGTFDTSVPGQISFVGYKTGAALTKQGAVLFNVTFHTKEEGTGDITLSKAEFGMPGYLSSSNVYLAAAVDTAEVEIKELPFLATDLDSSYYLTGEARTFTVTITNYGTTYTGAVLNLTLPIGVTVTGVPATIDLVAGASQPLTLTFTSTTPGAKAIGFDLKDSLGALLFSTVETATVYTAPVITAAFPTGPYVAGVPVTVPISITNPDGIPGPFALVLNLPAGTTFTFGGETYSCTETGCPPIPVTLPIYPASNLIITFDEGWTGDIIMNLYDTSLEPDRLLATFTQTDVTVLGAFDVIGTVSMQGRSARAGVPLILTGPVDFAYGPYYATSTALISNNYVFEDVAEGTYTFTTNQLRYLNLTTDSAKSITVNSAKTMRALMLRGGNVKNEGDSLDKVEIGDAAVIGGAYGSSGNPSLIPADANFDGRVNILDLALVGGNFELTSATAYTSWVP